ncbi:MAG: hypothetical protein RL518_1862 [Pseudomonadota bacterium]|jgi:hemoglobin
MDQDTLFAKYGGFETVSKLVSIFYDSVLADADLAMFFEHVDMEQLMKHQTAFIGMVLGGPASQYTGRDLKTAHSRLSITNDHFSKVAKHLQAALEACSVESDDITVIMNAVAATRGDIVSR